MAAMRAGVVVFPGSNCDADCHHAIAAVTGLDVRYVWHDGQYHIAPHARDETVKEPPG